ncbi:MAG: AAA family ATPase [Verrucomicrobiales bacterium]
MFLKRIRLQNVRCFTDCEIDFSQSGDSMEGNGSSQSSQVGNRKWTIILGENGTGKSTLLKACALVTAGSEALSELVGEPDHWVRIGEESCVISAILETKAGEDREVSLEIRRNDKISDIITRSTVTLELLNNALDHTDRNYFTVATELRGGFPTLCGEKDQLSVPTVAGM